MKTITASNIKSLNKKVNDFTFTNSAYRPTHITRTNKAKAKKKASADTKEDEEESTPSEFTCLLEITEDTRPKTATFFHGTLEQLTSSTLAEIPTRSITYKKICPDEADKVIAIVVQ